MYFCYVDSVAAEMTNCRSEASSILDDVVAVVAAMVLVVVDGVVLVSGDAVFVGCSCGEQGGYTGHHNNQADPVVNLMPGHIGLC